jgi:hypothetical protein
VWGQGSGGRRGIHPGVGSRFDLSGDIGHIRVVDARFKGDRGERGGAKERMKAWVKSGREAPWANKAARKTAPAARGPLLNFHPVKDAVFQSTQPSHP